MTAFGWLRCRWRAYRETWIRGCDVPLLQQPRCTRWRWHGGEHRWENDPEERA